MHPKPKLEVLMMFGNNQTQKAGENSQLVQAGTVNIFNGIDEKRAREICSETYAIARRDFTADAYACANARVQQFENSLIPKMLQIETALSAFSDPAFQFLLASAQRTAAATERNADYDMLSELLICRIEKGQSRKTRAGISRAVEIVDKIDDDALCALTVCHAVNKLVPKANGCKEGLKVLSDLFGKLIYMELPLGMDWIDHLDILDTVRINTFGKPKKIGEYYPDKLKGYSAAGIDTRTDNYQKALELLSSINLNSSVLIANELLPNYVRLPVVNRAKIKQLNRSSTKIVNGVVTEVFERLSENDIAVLENIWGLYTTDTTIVQNVITAFMSEWDSYPSLKMLHTWWDSLPCVFDITHVGTVLAHTNARRCDKRIPELPLAT